MSTAIAKLPSAAVSGSTINDDQVELIKRTIAKGASNDELALFIATANRLGLDPFARQIFAIKRGGVMSIQVSIDGFRLAADRTGRYAPGRPTEYEHDDDGKLVCATAYVKKHVAGEWHEIGETSYLAEYVQSSNALWKTMPRVMLAKTAEARALRRAFPAELSGAYAPEEMDQADAPRTAVSPPAFRAPDAVDPGVVADSKASLSLVRRLSDADSLGALDALVPELKAYAGGDKEEMRKLFGIKKRQLTKLEEERAGIVEDESGERYYDETGEVVA